MNPRAIRILRRTTAIAVGMCLSLSAAVLPADAQSSAAFDAKSTGVPRPETIPSLDGWKASQGAWTLLPTAHVVSSNLESRATELAQELSTFTGNTISATTQHTDSSDITLNLDTAQADTLGNEGFTLSIGEQGVTISAATEIGVFYGTRALSQMLRQTTTLPAGSVTSKPKYRERGATLCACQINMSTDWIDRFLEQMADLRLNYLLLEMKLKSSSYPKTATWSYYTPEDVAAFVKKAKHYGIDVIPEINSPGHMNIWLEHYPEYQLVRNDGTRKADQLDITNPEAVAFYKKIIDEYDDAFDTNYWHMGADEYMIGDSYTNFPQIERFAKATYGQAANANDAFTGFINDINRYVRAKGKTLRIWNDGVADTDAVRLDRNIVVEYWYAHGRQPQQLMNDGYELMNASQRLYWSRSAKSAYTVNPKNLYENGWNVGTFDGNRQIDPDYSMLRGAKVSIWPDRSDLQTEQEVWDEIQDGLRFIAQMTWSASRPWSNWAGMKQTIDAIGAPISLRSLNLTPLAEGTYQIPELSSIHDGNWQLNYTPDHYYQLKAVEKNKCLALNAGIGADQGLITKHLNVVTQAGARPTLVDCVDMSGTYKDVAGSPARNERKWQIRKASDGKYTIAPALTQQRLAVASGDEENIDLTLIRQTVPDQAPTAGTVVQLPADIAGSKAHFTFVQQAGLNVESHETTVQPNAPVDITVGLQAASDLPTSNGTITATVPEGWKVTPSSVDLRAVPAGEKARAVFRVVNTTGEGSADVSFTFTEAASGTEGSETAKTLQASTKVNGVLTRAVEADKSTILADSQETHGENAPAINAFDGDPATFWHTQWDPSEALPPHWIAFKAKAGERTVTALKVLPRQGRLNGTIRHYEVYAVPAGTATSANDISDWGAVRAQGEFPYGADLRTVTLPNMPQGDVFIKLVARDMYPIPEKYPNGEAANFSTIAELNAVVPIDASELTEPEQPKDNPYVAPSGVVRAEGDAEGDDVRNVEQGQNIVINAQNFAAGSKLTFTLHSDPVTLCRDVTADAHGNARCEANIPESTPAGEHHVLIENDSERVEMPLTVTAKPDEGKPDDGKPDNGKPDDGKPDDGKPDDGKTPGKDDGTGTDEGKDDGTNPDPGKTDGNTDGNIDGKSDGKTDGNTKNNAKDTKHNSTKSKNSKATKRLAATGTNTLTLAIMLGVCVVAGIALALNRREI